MAGSDADSDVEKRWVQKLMLMFTFKIEMAADLVVTDDIDHNADAEKLVTEAGADADIDADAGKSDAGRNRVVTDDHDADAGPHSLPPAFL